MKQSQDPAARELPRDQWVQYFDRLNQEYAGARAHVEVMGPEIGRQVELDDRPFNGISADPKAGRIWLDVSMEPGRHVSRDLSDVTVVRVTEQGGQAWTALEVVSGDGKKAVIRIERPGR